MRILVTGGAGYIGSHMVHMLLAARHDVVVLDDLSSGHRDAVPESIELVKCDVADRTAVANTLRRGRIEAIIHFASRIQVGESVVQPRLYYTGNLGAAIALLESALDSGVRHFVLSSTAAVYGTPARVPIEEGDALAPINPYGETKLAIERMLAAYGRAYGLGYAALRYFNAAGANAEAGLGERHHPETHLLPIVIEAALGRRKVTVFGTDYDTPDGTCIRDYIHVVDLCEAHLAALEHLARGGDGGAFNLGTGHGASVKEVIDAVEKVSGARVPVTYGPRRAGDPARLVASPQKARRELGWEPKRSSLENIVGDAWRFHSARG
jgi:UDP-glucose-4-epimerase GalE